MNPDDRPRTLSPDQVEWVPSSPDAIEVRVFGTWHGPTVPPPAVLLLNGERIEQLGSPPGDDVPPAWSAAFHVPVEARSAVEAGDASLDVGGLVVGLPPATPGRMVEPTSQIGTLVDPAVLAERRARRAEIAEQSAAERAATAEQEASTLRTQLEHIEERLARAAEERDSLAFRVADAERRLRLAEQREEAERRRRGELEEELASERRSVEQELRDLSDRLASAEEVTEALERELAGARRREEAERAAREHVDEQLRVALERVSALEGEAGDNGEELRRQAAILADRLAEAEAERARLETIAAELDQLRVRLEDAERERDDVADLRRRLAEAESARDEVADLRSRLDEAERERGDVAELRRRLAEVDAARDEVEDLRGRVADAERVEAEVVDLRRRLAEAEEARDELRARIETAPAASETADAEIAELRRRLDETLAELDREREAHAATEHARRLAVQRTREAREAAERGGGAGSSAREQELAEQVAALQTEIAGRAETHLRVQKAIEAVRSELGRVRAHVLAERSADAPEVEELSERVRLLEELVRRRDAELEGARAALAEAERAADEARSSSAGADTLRADFQARIRELGAAVAEMRERLRETTSDFERRLTEERTRREAAEAALAALRAAPAAETGPPRATETAPTPPERTTAPDGDDALEALIAGLREQVESAREQLRAWDAPAEPGRDDTPPGPPPGHEHAPPGPPGPSHEKATRERLRAIEADLRATVPDAGSSVSAREVIASLQEAAARLRAAAEEELAHAEAEESSAPDGPRVEDVGAPADVPEAVVETVPPAEPPAGEALALAPRAPAAPPSPEPHVALGSRTVDLGAVASPGLEPHVALGSRAVDFGAAESPWLRKAIARLAQSDPTRAADLLVTLLPLQATAGVDLTYVLTAPTLGAVRVVLGSGSVAIERRPSSLTADARISGSLATLAPLVAGGAGLRVKGVRIEGAKRPAKKLLRRRTSVGLGDFALVRPAPRADLVLAALAAAIEPGWTHGHRFGVVYDVEGERSTVLVTHGEPLRVTASTAVPHAATVTLTRESLLPALQGAASDATVAGDRRAVDVLHAWFDRARGVAGG